MKKLLIIALLLSFSVFSVYAAYGIPVTTQKKYPNYVQYLLMKKEVAKLNLQNIDKLGYFPKQVIRVKDDIKVVPRPNPIKKVHRPEHPKADSLGLLSLPNIEEKKENETIKYVDKELKRLGVDLYRKDTI